MLAGDRVDERRAGVGGGRDAVVGEDDVPGQPPAAVIWLPKLADRTRTGPARPGLLTPTKGSPGCSTSGTCLFTLTPFQDTLRMLIAEATRSASVIAFQILFVVTSRVYCE